MRINKDKKKKKLPNELDKLESLESNSSKRVDICNKF